MNIIKLKESLLCAIFMLYKNFMVKATFVKLKSYHRKCGKLLLTRGSGEPVSLT